MMLFLAQRKDRGGGIRRGGPSVEEQLPSVESSRREEHWVIYHGHFTKETPATQNCPRANPAVCEAVTSCNCKDSRRRHSKSLHEPGE